VTLDSDSFGPPEHNLGLQRLLRALRESESTEEQMRAIAEEMRRLTASAHTSVRLIDASKKRLMFSTQAGRELQGHASSRSNLTQLDDQVIESRAGVVLDAITGDGLFAHGQSGNWTPSAVIAEPLLSRDRCLGILIAAWDGDRPYCGRDRELLRMLATIAEPYLEIARLKELATPDSLTGLFNRYQLDECGPALVTAALKDTRPLSAVMIDLNGFSEVNNKLGHPAGDEILRSVGRALRQASRGGDIVARYGGDEFLVLALDADKAEGYNVAMRMSQAIAQEPASTERGPVNVSACLGVASVRRSDTLEALVARADDALLRAKQLRRRFNCASRIDTDGWE